MNLRESYKDISPMIKKIDTLKKLSCYSSDINNSIKSFADEQVIGYQVSRHKALLNQDINEKIIFGLDKEMSGVLGYIYSLNKHFNSTPFVYK